MIEVCIGELVEPAAGAVLRPVAADWSAVTPATRRLELAAGAVVAEQCRRLGELPVGSAVITPAGDLEAEYLVHVVVRSADQRVTADGVRRGLLNGLRRLEEWGIESVVLPPLGTGAGNLDAEEAAGIMVPMLVEQLRSSARLSRVVVVVDNDYERDVFRRAVPPEFDAATGPPAPGLPA